MLRKVWRLCHVFWIWCMLHNGCGTFTESQRWCRDVPTTSMARVLKPDARCMVRRDTCPPRLLYWSPCIPLLVSPPPLLAPLLVPLTLVPLLLWTLHTFGDDCGTSSARLLIPSTRRTTFAVRLLNLGARHLIPIHTLSLAQYIVSLGDPLRSYRPAMAHG